MTEDMQDEKNALTAVMRQPWQAPILRTLAGHEAEHGDSGVPEAITYS